MHWATPKTDRMIKSSASSVNQTFGSSNPFRKPDGLPTPNPFKKEYDPSLLKSQQHDNSQSKAKKQSHFTSEAALDSDSFIKIEVDELYGKNNRLICNQKTITR